MDEFVENFHLLFKEGFLSILIVKNPENNNLYMLKNNKDLFIFYDYKEELKSNTLVNPFLIDIKRIIPNYFETLYFVYCLKYKIHKIKITLDLSNFGYFIKDKVIQNYFILNENNEEKKFYSINLFSKNTKLWYDIFCLENPNIGNILSNWIKYGNKKLFNKLDALILINGYNLILKSLKIPQKEYYNKIILQINKNDIQNKKFWRRIN